MIDLQTHWKGLIMTRIFVSFRIKTKGDGQSRRRTNAFKKNQRKRPPPAINRLQLEIQIVTATTPNMNLVMKIATLKSTQRYPWSILHKILINDRNLNAGFL